MFTNYHILIIISYLCTRNAQSLARITKSDMEIQRYNRLMIVLVKKEVTGTWLAEQMGHNIFVKRVRSRIRSIFSERRKSRTNNFTRMANRSALLDAYKTKNELSSVEQLYEIARHLDVDVKELLLSSK